MLLCVLVFCTCPSAAQSAPLRVGVLREPGNTAHAAAADAFFRALAAMARPEKAALILRRDDASPEIPEPAKKISLPRDLDAIAVLGGENWQRVLRANATGATGAADTNRPLLFGLTPDCLPPGDGLQRDNVVPFSADFWPRRLRFLHAVTGFSRLGIILDRKDETAPLVQTLLASLADGNKAPFALFVFEDPPAVDAANCREAVDSLFFDEVNALLFEGSSCFTPGRLAQADRAELLDLLRGRGIMPLSLADPEAARHGALLAPWREEGAAVAAWRAVSFRFQRDIVTDFAEIFAVARRPENISSGDAPAYTVNAELALGMGFAPPPGLLATAREFIPPAAGGENAPGNAGADGR